MNDWLTRDFSEWTLIDDGRAGCRHLWKQEPRPGGYETWATVETDDYDFYQFRQCVVCGAKQLKDEES